MDDLIDEVVSALVELKDYYYQNSRDTLKGMGVSLPDEFDVLIGKLRLHSVFFRSTVLRLSMDSIRLFIVVSDNIVSYYCVSSEGVSKYGSLQELCYVSGFAVGMDVFIKEQLESFYDVLLIPSRDGDSYDVSGGSLIKGDSVEVSNRAVSLPVRSARASVSSKPKPKMEDRKYSKDELRNMLKTNMSSDVSLSDSSFRDDGDVDVESTRFTRREDIKHLPLSNELGSMFNKPVVNLGNESNSFNEGNASAINYNKDYTGRNWN